jgi:hypothetical protein
MKKIACLFRGNLRREDRSKGKFGSVIRSVKYLFDTDSIDFYMHLWGDEDDIKKYDSHFDTNNIILENNADYKLEIDSIIDRYDIRKDRSYPQVSSTISLEKVCKLFESNKKENYDIVFITRPDLPFLVKTSIDQVEKNTILFNRHGPQIGAGDYCFFLNESNVDIFENMYSYLKNNPSKLSPITHFWFHHYVTKICNLNVELSDVDVGINCEIFKHHHSYDHLRNSYAQLYGD